ncbi:MAG: carboxylesterase family protein [Porticoccaceae bacterium]|nr:carboxylesterase family protein [Porticoccaceae bacterium]
MISVKKLWTKLLLLCLLVSVSACNVGLNSDSLEGPLLRLNDASVFEGQLSESGITESFLGVPFAQPPVGALRWAPPQPLQMTQGIYQADTFAPACMQGDHIAKWYQNVAADFGGDPTLIKQPKVSEDCLYLNLWRPVQDKENPQALPVIVYIYGGSNKAGWSYEPNYIGHNLAAKGVIVVSIAYRVGVFGFFSHPSLVPANFGLLDQVAALQWVTDNIDNIGGDSQKITVMGESAGANNIDYLMVMPSSKGLFSKVIHQSGGSSLTNRSVREAHLALGHVFAQQTVGDDVDDPIRAMRQLSADTILQAADTVFKNHYFDAVVDGHSVRESIMDTLRDGKMHAVDLLIGSNDDEWLMYTGDQPDIEGWLDAEVAPSSVDTLHTILVAETDDRRKLDLLRTAKYYVCPSLVLAQEVSNVGRRAWVYHFTRQREGDLAATMGAYHGAELPYVFDTHDVWLPTVEADHRLTKVMQSYWVNFATNGNPNQSDLQPWLPFKSDARNIQSIGDTLYSSEHPSQPLCAFLSPT